MTKFVPCLALGVLAVAFAGTAVAGPSGRRSPVAPRRIAGPPSHQLANVGVNSRTIYIAEPDARGRPVWKLWAQEFHGTGQGAGFEGTMQNVSGIFFKNGRPAARMRADQAVGDTLKKSVTASGSVRVQSLTETGTSLQAQTLVWYAATNQIVASGHVLYRNGKTGIVVACPGLVADTVLKSVRSTQGGRITVPKGF